MFIVFLALGVLCVSAAPPRDIPEIFRRGSTTPASLHLGDSIIPKNVVTVPPNCPPGTQLINGECRDIWRSGQLDLEQNFYPKNVVTVPPNCPPGQELINGECRDIWRAGLLTESVLLRKLLEDQLSEESELPSDDSLRNIISVPNQCPVGYRPDALGICREMLFEV